MRWHYPRPIRFTYQTCYLSPRKIPSEDRTRSSGVRKHGAHSQRTERTYPCHVRLFVWQRDGGKWVLCGKQERLEYDHVIPVAEGGSNTERNIQLLCDTCN